MPEQFLILSGYTPAGLSNQRMELEIKAALALLSRRTLVLPSQVRVYSTSSDKVSGPVRTLVEKLQPLPAYREFATEFSSHLGLYNVIHVRRSDFLKNAWMKLPDATEIVRNLDSLFPREELLLICTDEFENRDFFRPLF